MVFLLSQVPHPGTLMLKMADAMSTDSRCDENKGNIFDIMQKQVPLTLKINNFDNALIKETDDNSFLSQRDTKSFRNLPGLHTRNPHVSDVVKEDQQKQDDIGNGMSSSPDSKRQKISTGIPDPCVSPDAGTKRRRIQHDYRRLSNSGYLDDYVGREGRFSTSDSDMSCSPSPPKQKVNYSPVLKPLVTSSLIKGTIFKIFVIFMFCHSFSIIVLKHI